MSQESSYIQRARKWSMPNAKTFEIQPIKELLLEETEFWSLSIADPFPYEYSKDATDYLNELENESIECMLFDPPYSPRQLKEMYKGKGEYDTKASTWSSWKDLASKKVKIGGKCISFGWSSQGMGLDRGFEIYRILLVPHGGMHNDTIVTCERKVKKGKEEFYCTKCNIEFLGIVGKTKCPKCGAGCN